MQDPPTCCTKTVELDTPRMQPVTTTRRRPGAKWRDSLMATSKRIIGWCAKRARDWFSTAVEAGIQIASFW